MRLRASLHKFRCDVEEEIVQERICHGNADDILLLVILQPMLLHFNLETHTRERGNGSRIPLLGFCRKDQHPIPHLATVCTPTRKIEQYQIIIDESMESSKVWVGRSTWCTRGGGR